MWNILFSWALTQIQSLNILFDSRLILWYIILSIYNKSLFLNFFLDMGKADVFSIQGLCDVMSLWNDLPEDIKQSCTNDAFKKGLITDIFKKCCEC